MHIIIIFLIVSIEHRPTVFRAESIHQVLARLLKITTPEELRSCQLITKVQVAIHRIIILRILDSPNRFLSVLILRQKIICKIFFQTKTSGSHDSIIRIRNYSFQIIFINFDHFILFILAISFVKHHLCQIGRCSSLRRTPFFHLCIGKMIICKLKVICYLLPKLVVSILSVRNLGIVRSRNRFIYINDMLEHHFQQKHIMTT